MPAALLVSPDYVKTVLKITSAAEDERIEELIRAAGAGAEKLCGRRFLRDSYVEYHHGSGRHALALRNRPVWGVSDVRVDEQGFSGQGVSPFAADTALVAGTDYFVDYDGEDAGVSSPSYTTGYMTAQPMSSSGLLYRVRSPWPRWPGWRERGLISADGAPPARGNVKIAYEGGYDELPADLAYALALTVQQMRLFLAQGGMMQSEKIGDYSYTLFNLALLPRNGANPYVLATVNDALARYREVPW